MTKQKTYICDNCGDEILGESRRINIRGQLEIYGPGLEKPVEVDKDLCLSCAKESFDMNVLAITIESRNQVDFET